MSSDSLLECMYCGYQWEQWVYPHQLAEAKLPRCQRCKDSNVRVLKQAGESYDVFGYNYDQKGKKK